MSQRKRFEGAVYEVFTAIYVSAFTVLEEQHSSFIIVLDLELLFLFYMYIYIFEHNLCIGDVKVSPEGRCVELLQ